MYSSKTSKSRRELIERTKRFVHGKFLIGEIDSSRNFNVYLVPTRFLIHNPHNSRFKSKILSCSDYPEGSNFYFSEEGQERIKGWILSQNKEINNSSSEDIRKKGQQEPGLITADGLVINGNRRLALIKELYKEGNDEKFSYLKVVILEGVFSDDIEKIKDFERKIQFCKENSIDYDRINKMLAVCSYIKHNPKKKDNEIKELFKWDGTIKQLRLTMEYINHYLDYCGNKENYNVVNGKEDQFKYLSKNHNELQKKIENNEIKTVNWKPKRIDIEDFKFFFFKLLRFSPTQPKLRAMVETKNKINIMSYKEIWDYFKSRVGDFYKKGENAVISREKQEGKKLTPEKVEETFKNKGGDDFKFFCTDIENKIFSKRQGNQQEPLTDELEKNILKIEDFIKNDKEKIKDNLKKILRKNAEKLLKLVEYIKKTKN